MWWPRHYCSGIFQEDNVIADGLSRQHNLQTEWSLHPEHFGPVFLYRGRPIFDTLQRSAAAFRVAFLKRVGHSRSWTNPRLAR